MQVFFLSLFPGMFAGPLTESILERAQKAGIFSYQVINPRDYSKSVHLTVDDYSYGGGPGMVMQPGPIYRAHEEAQKQLAGKKVRTILLSPTGKRFTGEDVKRLAQEESLIFICGHYEGLDERIVDLADESLSLGDFVLTGGELPAMVMVDAIARFLPGVLGHEEGAHDESFSEGLLEHPQYTRPPIFEEKAVPDVLLSGHHGDIMNWRRRESLVRTMRHRPDLLLQTDLSPADLKLLPLDPKTWDGKS